jgi:hypothetical protein
MIYSVNVFDVGFITFINMLMFFVLPTLHVLQIAYTNYKNYLAGCLSFTCVYNTVFYCLTSQSFKLFTSIVSDLHIYHFVISMI